MGTDNNLDGIMIETIIINWLVNHSG